MNNKIKPVQNTYLKSDKKRREEFQKLINESHAVQKDSEFFKKLQDAWK